ncbi:pancreatic triacylglycerol lipase [Galendromus occidentalis]|uniref:Pancreatic triacylglycerol lipase n=1 Tax=Galendromus occidentalis TaxID=34638 RepID=A0AAJ6QV30_9ACAR|nr:pancreatic triacylglycerol lipase [Galendromus occidentalis]
MARRALLLVLLLCANAPGLNARKDEVCFGELRCIPLRDCPKRPLNPEPDPRETINTQFLFFSRESFGEEQKIPGYKIKRDVLLNTKFDPARRTMIIVHGWIDNVFLGKWMTIMKDALLRNGDFNVILVDWTGGNGLPYTQASVNTRLVGAEIGLLVTKLMETFGISPSTVHAYGHSLGAHVVGFAGKWLNGTLGRITSLDPAEPLFEFCPPQARLSNTDAEFVEVVHTDSSSFVPHLGLGMDLAVGDVDFYPNGGQHMPGCNLNDRFVRIQDKNILEGIRTVAACNHMRAIDYVIQFLENSVVNSTCTPIAFACQNYEIFERGYCSDCGSDGSRCAVMSLDDANHNGGLRKKSNDPVRMYFKTGPKSPFCLHHYNIEMKMLRDPKKRLQEVSGDVTIEIAMARGISRKFELKQENGDDFTPGAAYRYLITSEIPLEDVSHITLTYRSKKLLFAPKLSVKYLKFTPMTATKSRMDLKKLSKFFCPKISAVESRYPSKLREEFC